VVAVVVVLRRRRGSLVGRGALGEHPAGGVVGRVAGVGQLVGELDLIVERVVAGLAGRGLGGGGISVGLHRERGSARSGLPAQLVVGHRRGVGGLACAGDVAARVGHRGLEAALVVGVRRGARGGAVGDRGGERVSGVVVGVVGGGRRGGHDPR